MSRDEVIGGRTVICGNARRPGATAEELKVCPFHEDGVHRLTEREPIVADQFPGGVVDVILVCKCGYFRL
jgi:hypothetical protein